MTSSANYFMVLWDIPKSYTREQVLVYYQSTSTILRFQVLESVSFSSKKRMGLMQMATAEDLMHCVCRFLNEGETKMRHFISQNQSEVIDLLLKKPSHIRVSFDRTTDESLPDKILNLFKKCGNVALLSQHSDGLREEWMLQVDSSYQLGQVCTGTSFMFGATQVQLEFFEDFIEEQDAALILANAEEVVNRLEHYYQGLGLFVKSTISSLEEDSHQVQTCYEYLQKGKDDEFLESVFDEDEADENLYVFDPSKVYGKFELVGPTKSHSQSFVALENSSTIDPFGKLQFHQSAEDERFLIDSPQLTSENQINWTRLMRQPDIENRILDAVDKLSSNGITLDARFIQGVESKISADTPKSERLRAILKIVKTKVRKLKRRDKRKQPKPASHQTQPKETETGCQPDSDDESDEMDLGAKHDPLKVRYKKCSADEVNLRFAKYPNEWVMFLSQNLIEVEEENPKLILNHPVIKRSISNDAAEAHQESALQLSTEKVAIASPYTAATGILSEWQQSVLSSGDRERKPPVGWPDCYHPNLRLNRRKTYGYRCSRSYTFNTPVQ
jgi:hypothetical protein